MKTTQKIALITALVAAPFASADVEIKVPSSVDILAVNESKPDLDGGLFSSHKTMTLPDGQNQIVFQYQVAFDQGNDREFIDSDTIIATFDASNTTLTFNMPKYRNISAAKEGMKDLQWSLVDSDQKTVETKKDTLVKKGMQIGRNYPTEAANYNKQGGVAALASTTASAATINAAAANTPVQPVTLPANVKASDNTAEEMLYFWYEKADDATKQRFKEFVNK
ncbi:DUF2057 family protein [Vibrio fortis]|uniref:DUF2057 family protein n=1 Tax=Vibrio fortis TaxID=212667 RepID=UPI002F3FB592